MKYVRITAYVSPAWAFVCMYVCVVENILVLFGMSTATSFHGAVDLVTYRWFRDQRERVSSNVLE